MDKRSTQLRELVEAVSALAFIALVTWIAINVPWASVWKWLWDALIKPAAPLI
jgi:hypothetical protein